MTRRKDYGATMLPVLPWATVRRNLLVTNGSGVLRSTVTAPVLPLPPLTSRCVLIALGRLTPLCPLGLSLCRCWRPCRQSHLLVLLSDLFGLVPLPIALPRRSFLPVTFRYVLVAVPDDSTWWCRSSSGIAPSFGACLTVNVSVFAVAILAWRDARFSFQFSMSRILSCSIEER